MRVVWTPEALRQVAQIGSCLAEFSPLGAARITVALGAAADRLIDFPQRGRPVGAGIRELTVVHPYIIRYEIVGDIVVILRVRHGRRRAD